MSRRKKREIEEQELNLVPIMNLVTILIPFLLMSAQFVSLAVIDSTLPAITQNTTPEPPDPNEEPPLNLSILITGNGFAIKGSTVQQILGDGSDDEEVTKVPCLDAGCRTPESYDYRGLTEKLAKIKTRHEDEENVILVPGGGTPYEVLVHTMDAARDDQEDKNEDNKARLLFPFVVIAAGVN